MSVLDDLLSILVPHACMGCDREGDLICASCIEALSPGPLLNMNGDLEAIQSATIYGAAAKAVIWKLKSGGAQSAAKVMARAMAPLLPTGGKFLLVPAPTASSRVRRRGYDQSKLLATCLAASTEHVYYDCLSRSGQSHQVGASRRQRLMQLQDAFRVKKAVAGANIVLIDDVTTTGATLESAARALKLAGAHQIQALTFAYKPKSSE